MTPNSWINCTQLPVSQAATVQHCYNGDVGFLWEKLELWPPVKFKPSYRLSPNLSQLITSTRRRHKPNLVKIHSRGTSGQIGKMSLSCDFFYLFVCQTGEFIDSARPFISWSAKRCRKLAKLTKKLLTLELGLRLRLVIFIRLQFGCDYRIQTILSSDEITQMRNLWTQSVSVFCWHLIMNQTRNDTIWQSTARCFSLGQHTHTDRHTPF